MTRDHIGTAHTTLAMRQAYGFAVPPVLADAVAHLAAHPDQIRSRLAVGEPHAGLTPEEFERAFLLPCLLRRLAKGAPLDPQLEKHMRVGDRGYVLGMHPSVRCPHTRAAYALSHPGLWSLLGGDLRTLWVVLDTLEPACATDLRVYQDYLPTHRFIIDRLATDFSRVLAYLEHPDRLHTRSRAQRHACTRLRRLVAQLCAAVPTSRDIQVR